MKGIKAGKLEYQQGSIWGNPILRILRSQLGKLGKDIAALKRKLAALEVRKAEIEKLSGVSTVRRPLKR